MAFAFKRIKVTPVLARNWEISRRVFARHLHEVKHWEIICGDYTAAPDIEATWFIDPPYRGEPGMGYRHSSALIDYSRLASWAMSRTGSALGEETQRSIVGAIRWDAWHGDAGMDGGPKVVKTDKRVEVTALTAPIFTGGVFCRER